MLQALSDLLALSQETSANGHLWHRIALQQLQKLLPFWDTPALQRVSKSLADKGIIVIDSAPLAQAGELLFSLNETSPESDPPAKSPEPIVPTTTAPARQEANRPQHHSNKPGASLISDYWQPDEDLLQLLALNHNIPRDFALRQLEDFILYWKDRGQVSHSWASKFRQHVLKEWRFQQSRDNAQANREKASSDIASRWSPSPDALEILYRAGVNRTFIEDAIPEFVLYWRERGEVSSTWNSKFIAHIRRQWAKFNATLENDYEPRPIASNWQPNEDVYDILRLANIDLDFARQQVAEFVLFWRDTKQVHRSWNTKFLQHVKYKWSQQNNMLPNPESPHERPSSDHQPGQARDGSLIKRLSDRSWAKGIVDGI